MSATSAPYDYNHGSGSWDSSQTSRPYVRPSPSRYQCEIMEKDRLDCENIMYGATPGYGGYTSDYGGYTPGYGGYTSDYGGYTPGSGGYPSDSEYGGYTPGYGGYTSDYKKNKRSKTHSGDGGQFRALEGASTDEFRKFVEKSQKMEEEFGQKMTEMRTRIEKLTKEAKKRDLEHAKQLTKMRAEVAKVKKAMMAVQR